MVGLGFNTIIQDVLFFEHNHKIGSFEKVKELNREDLLDYLILLNAMVCFYAYYRENNYVEELDYTDFYNLFEVNKKKCEVVEESLDES